jgi:hypothetical protein
MPNKFEESTWPASKSILNTVNAIRNVIDHLKTYPIAQHLKLQYASALAAIGTGIGNIEHLAAYALCADAMNVALHQYNLHQHQEVDGEPYSVASSGSRDSGSISTSDFSLSQSEFPSPIHYANAREVLKATSHSPELHTPASTGPVFDPSDLNEFVGDLLEYVASTKNIEVVVHSPVEAEGFQGGCSI